MAGTQQEDVAIDRRPGRRTGTAGEWQSATSPLAASSRMRRTRTRVAFLGVVFETVVPLGMFEQDRENGVAGERQPAAARGQADHAVPGRVAASATDHHARRDLLLLIERSQLTAVLFQESFGRPPGNGHERRRRGGG